MIRTVALLAIAPIALITSNATSPRMREIRIDAFNYGYRVPTALPPGLTAFQLANIGTVSHEVQIFRFKKGIGTDSAQRIFMKGGVPDSLSDKFGAVLVADAGQTATERILVDLKRGEVYALVCSFQDTPTSPRHRKLGMYSVLSVK